MGANISIFYARMLLNRYLKYQYVQEKTSVITVWVVSFFFRVHKNQKQEQLIDLKLYEINPRSAHRPRVSFGRWGGRITARKKKKVLRKDPCLFVKTHSPKLHIFFPGRMSLLNQIKQSAILKHNKEVATSSHTEDPVHFLYDVTTLTCKLPAIKFWNFSSALVLHHISDNNH